MLLSGIFLCGGDGGWPQETAPGDRGLEEDYFGGRTRHVQGGQSAHRESGSAFRNAFLLKPQVRCTWDHTNNLRTEPTHTDARARRPSRTPHGTRRPAQEQPRSEPVAAPHLPFPRPVHVCIHVISNTSGDRTGSPRCLFTGTRGTVSRSQNWNSSSASQPFAPHFPVDSP